MLSGDERGGFIVGHVDDLARMANTTRTSVDRDKANLPHQNQETGCVRAPDMMATAAIGAEPASLLVGVTVRRK
jgi:hypothetical protein